MGLGDTFFAEGAAQADKIMDKYEKGRDQAHKEFMRKAEHQKITQEMIENQLLGNLARRAKAAELAGKVPMAGKFEAPDQQAMIQQGEDFLNRLEQKYGADKVKAIGELEGEAAVQAIKDLMNEDSVARDPQAALPTELPEKGDLGPAELGGEVYGPDQAVAPVGPDEEVPPGEEPMGFREIVERTPVIGKAFGLAEQGVDWLKDQMAGGDRRELIGLDMGFGSQYIPPQSLEEYEQRHPHDISKAELKLKEKQISAQGALTRSIITAETKAAIEGLRQQGKLGDAYKSQIQIIQDLINQRYGLKKAKVSAARTGRGSGSAERGRQFRADQNIIKQIGKELKEDVRFKYDYKYGAASLSTNADWLNYISGKYQNIKTDLGKREFQAAYGHLVPPMFLERGGRAAAKQRKIELSVNGQAMLSKLQSKKPKKAQAIKALDNARGKINEGEYNHIKQWIEKNLK